jgi:hypothetical protein
MIEAICTKARKFRAVLVAGRHTPLLLDPIDESLHNVASLVQNRIVLPPFLAILTWRDHNNRPLRLDGIEQSSAVIPLIGDCGLRLMLGLSTLDPA